MRLPTHLTATLIALMVAQSVVGLLWPGLYRDVAWITATWFGNDAITLIVAAPLLLLGRAGAARDSARAWLVAIGVNGYAAYNYAFYMLGTTLNSFFLVYVSAVVVAAAALIRALSLVDAGVIARRFRPETPTRLIGGLLVVVGAGLAAVWIAMWAAHVFAGRPTPVEPEAFRLVAALDLSAMVPALICGGVLLYQQRPWGYVLAALASIQGTLYLLVLSVNSIVAIQRGLVAAPGELPVWGPLTVLVGALAIALLVNAREHATPTT